MTVTALLLICQIATPRAECDERTAYDVVSMPVANELGCEHGWQEMVARGALKDLLDGLYVKTVCRRKKV